jgi:hypothetical protein
VTMSPWLISSSLCLQMCLRGQKLQMWPEIKWVFKLKSNYVRNRQVWQQWRCKQIYYTCKMWHFHSGDYEGCRLLGRGHMGLVRSDVLEEGVTSILRVERSWLANSLHHEDGGDTFLWNISSDKTHMVPHPRSRHSCLHRLRHTDITIRFHYISSSAQKHHRCFIQARDSSVAQAVEGGESYVEVLRHLAVCYMCTTPLHPQSDGTMESYA